MSTSIPDQFRITLSSFYGRSYTVLIRDGKLHYHSNRPEKMIKRRPADEDWQKFWKKTVSLKIWLWEKEYLDKSTSDGSNWSVNIEIGSLKLKSYGSNKKPENFSEFLDALRELLPGIELMLN